MDLITRLAEQQKAQDMQAQDLKKKILELQQEIVDVRGQKEDVELKLEMMKDEGQQIRAKLQEEMCALKKERDGFEKELTEVKIKWEVFERELTSNSEKILKEMRRLEDKNSTILEELSSSKMKIKALLVEGQSIKDEYEQLKGKTDELTRTSNELKTENDKMSNDLHNNKMQLLQERNTHERFCHEIKRLKKELDLTTDVLQNVKKDKDFLQTRLEENSFHGASKLREVEDNLRDVKTCLSVLIKGNGSLRDKVDTIHCLIKGEQRTVAVQTDCRHTDINQYERLDREATMLVMGLKEELVSMKDQLLSTKRENDCLKALVKEAKRESESRDEEQRVEKLESAVKSLSQMLVETDCQPSKEDVILKTLNDLKRDLYLIKSKTQSTVTRLAPTVTSSSRGVHFSDQISTTIEPSVEPVKMVSFRRFRR